MASSSSSAPAQEHHAVLVLVFLVGGKPWSETAPGTTFDSWWRKEFQNDDLPVGLSRDAAFLLNQQEEWVGAVSTRGGQDGTLKPREALLPAVAEAEWGDDQIGGKSGGVVKVVLRPVQSRSPGGKLQQSQSNQYKYHGVLRLGAKMHVRPVHRDDIRRSKPSSMALLLQSSDLQVVQGALRDALGRELSAVQQQLAGVKARKDPRQHNRLREKKCELEAILREFCTTPT